MIILGVLIVLAFTLSAFTAFKSFTLNPGEQVVVPGGITVSKPTNNIIDANLRADGVLVVKYEDGTTREVGYIMGQKGADGQSIPPTEAQISAAVVSYCTTNNRCDPLAPSAEQVATAVADYCSIRNSCQGTTGATGSSGQNATSEQVMAAVQTYCADGRCVGPTGAAGITGTNGTNGENPVMNCVVRTVNTLNRQYVAWKYPSEEDSAYRNLYMLPTWAQGENCVDLTA